MSDLRARWLDEVGDRWLGGVVVLLSPLTSNAEQVAPRAEQVAPSHDVIWVQENARRQRGRRALRLPEGKAGTSCQPAASQLLLCARRSALRGGQRSPPFV